MSTRPDPSRPVPMTRPGRVDHDPSPVSRAYYKKYARTGTGGARLRRVFGKSGRVEL